MIYLETNLDQDINKSEWLDGFNYKIILWRPAIQPCLNYALSSSAIHFGNGLEGQQNKQHIIELLQRLLHLQKYVLVRSHTINMSSEMIAEWNSLSSLFLSNSKKKHLPVTWFTPVSPKRKNAFLIQLLLTMGEFETEYELMACGNLRTAFILANLFNPQDPGGSVDNLLKRYVLEQLRTFPGNHYVFDSNLSLAESNLRELLLGTTPSPQSTPSVLYSHMKMETDQKIELHVTNERNRLIGTLHSDLSKCGFSSLLPTTTRIQMTRENPLLEGDINFYPPPHCPRQNLASHEEQTRVLLYAKQCIHDYINPAGIHKNLTIVGGPGVGKTTISQLITLYALCQGLNGTATSLVANRSKQLGGTHIHRLFGLRGFDTTFSPGQIAERTIRDLYRYPEILWMLLSLDFLFIDEFGLLSAELIAILDMILRYIRHSCIYMAGVLLFTTLDIKQLMPFVGIPAMLSAFVITEYAFMELTQSVRASGDPALQEICQLTRTVVWTVEGKKDWPSFCP